LEESLVRSIRGKGYQFRWDSAPTKNRVETWIVGEPILVEIELKNPLFIPIDVNNLHLSATFEPAAQEETSNALIEGEAQKDIPAPEYFRAEPVDIVLRSTEKKTVRLRIVALQPGQLNIRGVKWQLSGDERFC
jgi:hypothetical protein